MRTIPHSSRLSAELRVGGLSLAARTEPGDLSVLEDGDNRVRIHCSTGDEVSREPCFSERLSVGRVFEDLRDVVAILPVYELACARGVVAYDRHPRLHDGANVPSGTRRILETKMSLGARADNRNIRISSRRSPKHRRDGRQIDVGSDDDVARALQSSERFRPVRRGDDDGASRHCVSGELEWRVPHVEAGNGLHLPLSGEPHLRVLELLRAGYRFVDILDGNDAPGAVSQRYRDAGG